MLTLFAPRGPAPTASRPGGFPPGDARRGMDALLPVGYTSPMAEVLLIAQNLGRRAGGRWLWRGRSFDVDAQSQLALVGPSGVGKTTLLRAVAGLDPLDEGTLTLDGRPAEAWSPAVYRSRVMYLHQRPALLPGSVEENLQAAFALAVHRDKRYDPARARELVTRLGRSPAYLTQDSSQLSGGEAQILALVRALLLEPEILLLDEPTSSLDPQTTAQAEALLREWLAAAPRRACLWTSHDAAQIARVASRTIAMEPLTP